jgi:hypothetical protein
MKNTFKLLGIIAILAVIGFSAVSCEDKADDSTKSVTITGIPSQYYGEVVLGLYTNKADAQNLKFPDVGGTEMFSSGSVVRYGLWNNKKNEAWTGTGDYYLFFTVNPVGTNDLYVTKTKQKISKENTTVAFSEFERL